MGLAAVPEQNAMSPAKLDLGRAKQQSNLLDQTLEDGWDIDAADTSFDVVMEKIGGKGRRELSPVRNALSDKENIFL